MTHLSRDEWLTIVEAEGEPSHPHLASCAACRDEVAAGRALLAGMRQAPVPEPSPLYWEHFSARVSAGLSPAPARRWWSDWRLVVPMSAGAVALLLAVALGLGRPAPVPTVARPPTVAADASVPANALGDDAHWRLLSGMASDFDVETLRDSLGAAQPGGSEVGIAQLSEQERIELARLFRKELGPAPAGL